MDTRSGFYFVCLILGINLVQGATSYMDLFQNDRPCAGEIPRAGSNNFLENVVPLGKVRGHFYLRDLMKKNGLSVFKLKLFEDRLIIADPVGIHVIYNTELTEKSKDFGLAKLNALNMKRYSPSASTNGAQKAQKKEGMMKILDRAMNDLGWQGLFNIFQKHWKAALPLIKDENTNVENLIDDVTLDAFCEFFFGAPFALPIGAFFKWFMIGLTPKSKTPPEKLDAESQKIVDAVYNWLDSTPFAKNVLPEFLKTDSRSAEELKSEALAFCFVFAAFGMRSGLASSLSLYLNVNELTKNRIKRESRKFFSPNNKRCMNKKLAELKVIERFATEVYRFYPPVEQVFARAKKDFVLDSLQGRYMVKKGTYITGYSYGAQRDSRVFRSPERFYTRRNTRNVKRNFFTFGGPYKMKPTKNNRKCLGQEVALNMTKMFVAMFSQCDIVPASNTAFTEKSSPTRKVASDEPLRVKKFSC